MCVCVCVCVGVGGGGGGGRGGGGGETPVLVFPVFQSYRTPSFKAVIVSYKPSSPILIHLK